MRPVVPFALGFAGVLPFLGATLALAAGPADWAAPALTILMAYGMIILSFLGGVHWGVALSDSDPGRFIWSVTPSLIALAATFLPAPILLGVLAAAFVLAGGVDVAIFQRTGPAWYVGLRIALTAIVAPLLCVAALLI